MARPPQPAGAALRALILAKAATPAGYVASDAHHLPNYEQSARTCERMTKAGLLHPAKVRTHYLRHFTTAAAARHFEATTRPKTAEQKRADQCRRYANRVAQAALLPKAAKPAKPARPNKIIQRTAKQQMQVVERKAYTPPAPRKDAVIVWPARMPECRMMPPPRNQVITHSFIHGGMGAMR